MPDLYHISCQGDGACELDVPGPWPEVVRAVARQLYADPTPDDEIRVFEMLKHGVDGYPGWDGRSVQLLFEDGSIVVTIVQPKETDRATETHDSPPA